MSIDTYDLSVPVFSRMLTSLAGVLRKAEAHATAHRFDPAVLLQSRLYPDMFPLIKQVQVACDFAKGASCRLAGAPVPKFDDHEATFADLDKRIEGTQSLIRGLPRAGFADAATRIIEVPLREPIKMAGLPYLVNLALPNFYFHTTTAYAILRHNGVELGKADFIGSLA